MKYRTMKSMKVSTQPYKGARDFYPEDKARQTWMFDSWRRVVERYGYQEYDAPILEPTDLYLMKGSEEIVNEQTYTFQDRGKRSVTIRTEMTPSVSRMVAGKRQEIVLPVRWYSIPNMWRYERMQRGRLREFWQLNVDVFGVASEQAEIEMLQIADGIFQEFKATRDLYVIKVNSRKLVNALFTELCGLPSAKSAELVRLVDRKNKMELSAFKTAVQDITKDTKKTDIIIKTLDIKSLNDVPKSLKDMPSVHTLEKVLTTCKQQGMHNVEFDVSLMRGFDYYTDLVFEVFDTSPENNRAMFGGGRYDGLVAEFGVESIPTVGFGLGDVTFMNFLETHKLLKPYQPQTDIAVIVRSPEATDNARNIAQSLREYGLSVSVDYTDRKFDKQFKAVQKSGIAFALFVDESQNTSDTFVLKDMKTNKELVHSLERIAAIVLDNRK